MDNVHKVSEASVLFLYPPCRALQTLIVHPGGPRKVRKSPSTKPTPSPSSTKSSSPQPLSHIDNSTLSSPRPVGEARLPPKLRKKWIHRSSEVLKETVGTLSFDSNSSKVPQKQDAGVPVHAEFDDGTLAHYPLVLQAHHALFTLDSKVMPPPPLPHLIDSPSRSSVHELPPRAMPSHDPTSPTTSFANLSLLSPLVSGPTPHFPGSFARSLPKSTSPSPLGRSSAGAQESTVPSQSSPPHSRQEDSLLGCPIIRRDSEPSGMSEPSPQQGPASTGHPSSPAVPTVPSSEHVPSETCSPPEQRSEVMTDDADDAPRTTETAAETMSSAASPAMSPPEAPIEVVPMLVDHPQYIQVEPSVELAERSVHGGVAEEVSDHGDVPMSTAAEPSSSPSSLAPPPAPPQKVKLTLKDFARRKKLRQEEEKAAASPVIPSARLELDGPPPISHAPGSLPSEYRDTPRSPSPASSDVTVPQVSHDGDSDMHKETPSPSPAAGAHEQTTPMLVIEPASDGHDEAHAKDEAKTEDEPSLVSTSQPSSKDLKATLTSRSSVQTDGGGVTVEAKSELASPLLSSVRVSPSTGPVLSRSRTPPTPPRVPTPCWSPPPGQSRKENHEPVHVRDRPRRNQQQNLARQVSQEDGEIFSPPPPKPVPLAPRPRTPPTHPRFHPHSGGASPARGPPAASSRRSLQPPPYRAPMQNTPLNSRPLPSGPRALRGVGGAPPYPSSSYSSSSYSQSRADGPHVVPRGPSADRDRERMDWDRDRGRVGSWSRNRGGGNWVR